MFHNDDSEAETDSSDNFGRRNARHLKRIADLRCGDEDDSRTSDIDSRHDVECPHVASISGMVKEEDLNGLEKVVSNMSKILCISCMLTSPCRLQVVEEDVKDEPPNGGLRAWLVVLGSFLVHFIVLGIMYSWGVYQEFYLARGFASNSQLALIGTFTSATMPLFGVVSGR